MVAFANMSNNQLADLDASLAAIRTVNKMRDCMSEAALSETAKRIAENAAARIGNGLNAEKLLRLAEVTEWQGIGGARQPRPPQQISSGSKGRGSIGKYTKKTQNALRPDHFPLQNHFLIFCYDVFIFLFFFVWG